ELGQRVRGNRRWRGADRWFVELPAPGPRLRAAGPFRQAPRKGRDDLRLGDELETNHLGSAPPPMRRRRDRRLRHADELRSIEVADAGEAAEVRDLEHPRGGE